MSGNQKQTATEGPKTQRYSTPYQPIVSPSQNIAPVAYCPQQSAMMTRTPVAPAAAASPNTGPGNMASAPLITQPGQSGKRRANAISILDPNTGVDKLNEIFDELSGRQTPQPAVPNPKKEAQAAFAKLVAHAITKNLQHNLSNDDSVHDASPPEHFQSPPQTMQQIRVTHYDIQNSNLRPQGPHQIYSTSPYVLQPSTAIYIASNQMYFNHTPKPPTGIMPAPSYAPPGYQSQLAYQTFAYFPQQPAMMTRTSVAPAAAAPPNTGPENMPSAPLITKPDQSGNYQKSNQKKCWDFSIIDPTTGIDKLNEIFDEIISDPSSGESSARQTPQPAVPNPNKECLSNRKSNPGIRGDKDSNKQRPKVTISIGDKVKLHKTARKPLRFVKGAAVSEEEKKTEALYNKVRSILNKLTPQKFDTLVNQFRKLEIDTKDRLQGVVNLVFDKAIDEPTSLVAYAMMCKELQIMQAPAGNGDDKKSVAFRTLLVTRCQSEFEKQSVDETQRNNKIKEIENCADSEKKKELSSELKDYDRRLRMKSVGCVRFIGELFKQQMLTASLIRRCLQTLSDNKDEESLECLCELLKVVGKELEFKNVDLSSIFYEIKLIVNGERQKVSSEILIMLKDVIALRDSKWVPRRGDTTLKTISQIQREVETEYLNIEVMNMNITCKDDRGSGPSSSQRQKVTDDGWSSVGNSRNNRNQPLTIQTSKLRAARLPAVDKPLGSSQLFGHWGKAVGTCEAGLERVKRRLLQFNKDTCSSKGLSLERSSYKAYDERGSQHRDNVTSITSSSPPSAGPLMSPVATVQPKPTFPPTMPKLREEQIEILIYNSLDKYLTSSCTADEFFEDIAGSLPQSQFSKVVYESYNYTLDKSQTTRLKTGELFAKLIRTGRLSLESFMAGFGELLSLWDDLIIDIPQIWQHFAEDLVHLCLDDVLSFDRLQELLASLISNNVGQNLLTPLFGLIVKEKGSSFLQDAWRISGVKLSDFMSESEVQTFIKNNNFEFLVGGETPIKPSLLSYEEIQRKLSEFFRSKTPFDDIVNWISANVGESVKEKKFIRTLGTAIFEDSISKNRLVPEVLKGHSKLIHKYVNTNTNYELECLYALQSLAYKLKPPHGLLLSICDKLYEDGTFSEESFIAWENSADPAEQEGKGVALKQLTSFFTQLKENAEDEDYSSEDD